MTLDLVAVELQSREGEGEEEGEGEGEGERERERESKVIRETFTLYHERRGANLSQLYGTQPRHSDIVQ